MGLNRSTGNMYRFITHTWNIVKGKCPHDCSYCYMKRWGNQKPVRFDEKELKTDLEKDNFIFVGSSCDMFAKDIPDEWIYKTLDHCNKYPGNKYFFQTKNVNRFLIIDKEYGFPKNTSLCTTIETNRTYKNIMNNSPIPKERAAVMVMMQYFNKYITIEPIMDFDLKEMVRYVIACSPIQVNIGADSGNNNLPEPSKEKLLELIYELEKYTIVNQKKNLKRILV